MEVEITYKGHSYSRYGSPVEKMKEHLNDYFDLTLCTESLMLILSRRLFLLKVFLRLAKVGSQFITFYFVSCEA